MDRLKIKNECYLMSPAEIINEIITSRGIDDVSDFFNPDLDDYLKPFSETPKMEETAKVVAEYISKGKKIFLNVDSDADGVSSGTIIKKYIEMANPSIEVKWHISQGKTHGTSDELTYKLDKYQPDLLIIVDSLDSKLDNYIKYKERGIEIVVLDHHDIKPEIPYDDYVRLVSSNRSTNPELSGSGVCWKFCMALDELMDTDYALELADLASVGIIGDMVDVSERSMENRAIVNYGLSKINNLALKKIIGGYEFNSQAISFSVAPLINACCRFKQNDLAFETFISDDEKTIKENIKEMKEYKTKQKESTAKLIESAQIDNQENVVFALVSVDSDFKGLLANQLLSKYKKPVFVFKFNEFDYSGSARSIGDVDLKKLCIETGLCNADGHPSAFGITISSDYFDDFKRKINDLLSNVSFDQEIQVDCIIDDCFIEPEFIKTIKFYNKITGMGFRQINFAVNPDSYIAGTMTKGKHLTFETESNLKFIKWNAGDQIDYYEDEDKNLTFVGTLDDGFFGRKYVPRLILSNILVDLDD